MKFKEKVKELRTKQKLTINQLALKSGVNSGTISKIENGSQPSYLTIAKLAKGLGVDFSELWELRNNI